MEGNLIELDTPPSSAKKEEPKLASIPEDEANGTSPSTSKPQQDHSPSDDNNRNDTANDTKVKFEVRHFPQHWNLQDFDDFGRESLGIIDFDLLDLGRPSLAIVNLKSADPGVPEVIISPPKENMGAVDNTSILNAAFALPNNDYSIGSNISSIYSRDPCFSKSLNCSEFSTISNMRSASYRMDLSNDALETSKQFNKLHVSDSPTRSSGFGELENRKRRRIHSVPDEMKLLDGIHSNDGFLEDRNAMPKFSTRLLDQGSSNILDCTPQPDEFFELFEDNKSAIGRRDPDDIFKNLNKMRPLSSLIRPNASKCQSPRSGAISPKHVSHASTEESSKTKHSSNPKLSDARKMLHSLSAIINQDNFADDQKTEVQALLKSLNSLFSDPDDLPLNIDFNDSGHSSINAESGCVTSPVELARNAALNLSRKPVELVQSPPLDLSQKSKSVNVGGIAFDSATKSYVNKTVPNLTSLRGIKTVSPSIPKTKSISKLLVKSKELSKKSLDTRNKGPMKAIQPVGSVPRVDASGSNIQVTPKKNERRSTPFQKTSTPIDQGPIVKLTPESRISKSARPTASAYSQRVYPTSPLSSRSTYLRSVSAVDRNDKNKINDSKTSPKPTTPGIMKKDSKYQGYLRRRSTEVKPPLYGCTTVQNNNVLLPLPKSNNVGKSPSRNVKIVGNKNNSGGGENLLKNNLGFSTGRLSGKENFKR